VQRALAKVLGNRPYGVVSCSRDWSGASARGWSSDPANCSRNSTRAWGVQKIGGTAPLFRKPRPDERPGYPPIKWSRPCVLRACRRSSSSNWWNPKTRRRWLRWPMWAKRRARS